MVKRKVKMENFWKDIDDKKKKLDQNRPLAKNAVKSLRDKLALEWTHHSNAIEGNTLTLSETKVVLEGITIGGKSIKEHLEVIHHKKAIDYLESIISKKVELSEPEIKKIHSLILKNINPEHAGVYRTERVFITGARHIPPAPKKLEVKMKQLMKFYQEDWMNLHPVERSALLHIEFVKIHPFIDGNGRTSRLLQNFELMKYGFPPIIIKKEQKLEYYEALDKAHMTDNTKDFFKMCKESLNQSFNLYLEIIKEIE